MPIQIPTVQTGLEASIEAAAKRAGRSLKINMGPGAKSIEGLSQPLGRITGKADQFTKSMEAANARVLAFGASVGVLSAVTRGFKELVATTIEVEKQMTAINSILGQTSRELDRFKKEIFTVAKDTEQSFATVAEAALELSRQGLKAEEVTKRLNDSLVLSRLSGLGAAEAVAGLTSAINSFNATGITSAEVLNKLSAAAVSAAVSERDLIEGIKRSGAVAIQAGVSFNELVGVITAVQERTARGGAVIGNSFKTIFTRIQSLDKLETMQNLGVEVTDTAGQVLSATKLIQNLAKTLETLPEAKRLQIAENLVGKFQIAPFLAILEDYNRETSTAIRVTEVAANATNEAYSRNIALNKTLSAAINEATINLKELADTLGKIGVTDSLRNVLGFFNSMVEKVQNILEGEGMGSDFAKGIVKGIGGVLSGPGLAIFAAIIGKLAIDLAKFGVGSLKTFFGLNKAAQQQATLQGQIASTLLGNKGIQEQIMKIENSTLSVEQKRAAQIQFFTTALNQQLKIMTQMQSIAARVTPGVIAGTRGRAGRAAGGYIPNYNAVIGYGSEQADISRGVGGAPKSARPVTIPNFNFGGGQRGTVVANNSEYMVPNFAGGDGSAIFNQDMVNSMGLPANARRIGAAGGYIPNFAAATSKKRKINAKNFFYLVPRLKGGLQSQPLGDRTIGGQKVGGAIAYGLRRDKLQTASDNDETLLQKNITNSLVRHTSRWVNRLQPLGRSVKPDEVRRGFKNTRGAKGAMMGAIGAAFEVGITSALDYKAAAREKGGDFDVRGGVGLSKVRELFGFPATQNTGDFKVGTGSDSVISFYKKVIKERGAGTFGVKEQEKNVALLAKQELKRDRPDLFQKGSLTPIHATRGETDRLLQQRQAAIAPRFRGLARGYIPNYASSPLQDAISREAAAGLPINQIRINQDSSLKNAGNPMGLAVTNMRDEPTGAIPAARGFIPNYAVPFRAASTGKGVKDLGKSAKDTGKDIKDLGKSTTDTTGGQRDMLGGIFAVQMGLSFLTGATSDAEEGLEKFANITAKTFSGLTTAAFAGTAINDFGKQIGGAAGGIVSKLGMYGAAIGAGVAIFKGINEAVNEATGKNRAAAMAMAAVADSAKNLKFRFDGLNAVQKTAAEQEAKDILKMKVETQETRYTPTYGAGGGSHKYEVDVMRKRDFGSGDAGDKMEALFLEQSTRLIQLGMSAGAVKSKLDSFGVALDDKDLAVLTDFVESFDKETVDNMDKFKKGIKEASSRAIEDTLDLLKRKEEGDPEVGGDALEAQLDHLRSSAGVGETFGKELTLRNKILVLQDLMITKEKESNDEKKEGERITRQIAKNAIKDAVERAKMDRKALEEVELRILAAQELGTLNSDSLRNLQAEKNFIETNLKLRDLTLDAAQAMVDKSRELSFSERLSEDLRKKLVNIGKMGVSTDKDREAVLEAVNELLKESTGEVHAQLIPIKQALERDKDRVIAAKEYFALQQITTAEVEAQVTALKLASEFAKERDRDQTFDKAQAIRNRIAQREETIRRRSIGGKSEDEQDAINRLNARDRLLNVQDRTAEKKLLRDEAQRQQAAELIDKIIALADEDQKRMIRNTPGMGVTLTPGGQQVAGLSGVELQNVLFGAQGLGQIIGAQGIDMGNEATRLAEEFRRNNEQAVELGKAEEKLAKAAVDQANALNDLNFGQLLDNMIRGFESPQEAAQARIDALTSTDPATRIKFGLNEGNRQAKADALKLGKATGNFEDFRRIVEEEQLSNKLVDSSVEFAKNIGDAMVMAIARGEDLGDSLRSAASDFFLMLSKAFMQQAVNNIVGSGGGQGFIGGFVNLITGGIGKNAGGMITGGSGVRDDVPTLLTGGEFVMRKGAVQKYGTDFMSALNAGRIGGMQRGGYFTPGTFGQGAIVGKDALFDYATQSFTTGAKDRIMTGPGVGSVALEPHSVRMTRWAMKNSRLAQQERASQEGALGLYFQQLDKEKAEEEARKQQKRALRNSIISMVAMAALGGVTGGFGKNGGAGSMGFGDAGTSTPPVSGGGAQPWYKKLFSGVGNFFRGGGSGQTAAPRYGYGAGSGSGSGFTDVYGNPGVLPPRGWTNQAVMGGRRRFAAGGSVPYAAGIDTVPTMLSGGEFVMNAAATQNIGRGNLAAMNSGVGGRGGDRDVVNRLDELIAVSENQSGESVINITVNSDGTTVQNNENMNDDQQSLAMKIRDQVRQVIEEEKRLGGSLRPIRTARA